MKKILTISLFACLTLVVAYGGASYWMGGQARKHHDRLIEQINHSNYLKASIKSYERGLFSSRAITTFTFTGPKGEDAIKFSVIDFIYNGPFVFLNNPHLKGGLRPVLGVIRTRLTPEDSSEALKKVLEKVPEIESSEALTVISVDGSGESYLDIPHFQKKIPGDNGEEFDVEWGGFSAKSKFGSRLEEISGSFNAPSFQIAGGENRLLRVKDTQGDFDSHLGTKGIYVGTSAFSIGSIEVAEKENKVFNLVSVGLKAQSGVSGETIDGSIRLSFEKLNAGGMELGPFTFEFDGRKLDAEVLSRLQKLVPELQKEAVAEKAEGANGAMKEFTKIMGDLLAKSPEFEIKQLEIKTDKGDLKGRAKLAFTGPGMNLAGNILALIASIDASAEVSVSEALFIFIAENALHNDPKANSEEAKTNTDELVKGLIAANVMLREDGSFKSSATFRHGNLTVNGRKLDLSKLK